MKDDSFLREVWRSFKTVGWPFVLVGLLQGLMAAMVIWSLKR